MGQGPILVDKRLCNYFRLVLEKRTGLFWKPLESQGQFVGWRATCFSFQQGHVGRGANIIDRMLASRVQGHEFHTQQCNHSTKTKQHVDI